MPNDPTITEAIELAERILREVTGAVQNWQSIEHLATSLAALAGHAQRSAEGPEPGPDLLDG
jgi:hypothetical protein